MRGFFDFNSFPFVIHTKWSQKFPQNIFIFIFCLMNLFMVQADGSPDDMMNGFDGSLMGSINAMKPYHTYFDVGEQGGGTGIVFAIYAVGNLVGAFFAAHACDKYGRRFGMFSGSCFIVLGSILESTAKRGELSQFMGGRFLIGFGMTIATTSAPTYLVEMAYPSWRGVFDGLYNVVGYYVGAIGK
jgi:MFS family permease